jgi:hypothetical protein
MSAIGGHHAVGGCGGGLCVRDSQHRNPTNGRQGKRPALWAAYVVGWIREFASIRTHPAGAWRISLNEIKPPGAVALHGKMDTTDDDPR